MYKRSLQEREGVKERTGTVEFQRANLLIPPHVPPTPHTERSRRAPISATPQTHKSSTSLAVPQVDHRAAGALVVLGCSYNRITEHHEKKTTGSVLETTRHELTFWVTAVRCSSISSCSHLKPNQTKETESSDVSCTGSSHVLHTHTHAHIPQNTRQVPALGSNSFHATTYLFELVHCSLRENWLCLETLTWAIPQCRTCVRGVGKAGIQQSIGLR